MFDNAQELSLTENYEAKVVGRIMAQGPNVHLEGIDSFCYSKVQEEVLLEMVI